MKEELTTKMHAEFLGDEVTDLELKVMGVYGAVNRKVPLDDALKEYGLSKEQYEEGVEKFLS